MERLHTPNEFFRIRRLCEGMRAWEELWRLLADGPHRLARVYVPVLAGCSAVAVSSCSSSAIASSIETPGVVPYRLMCAAATDKRLGRIV